MTEIPTWLRAVAPIVVVLIIVAGGMWMRNLERRDRERSKKS